MITSSQLRAARVLLSIDQRNLAERADPPLSTIQRMEKCIDVIDDSTASLMKVVGALRSAGVELIAEGAPSQARGRGVRLTTRAMDIASDWEGSGPSLRRRMA